MNVYHVREVGTVAGRDIEAHNAQYAVAEAAGCDMKLVCIPIWEKFGGTGAWNQRVIESCYMPLDNTGRQWIVTHP